MSKVQLILGRSDVAEKVIAWVRAAKPGSRVTLEEPRRSNEQNKRFWAMLHDVSEQVTHNGRKYEPEEWKHIFMHALGKEMRFLPALDGRTFVPIGMSSSKLTVAEMADMQEFITAWGRENGVCFLEDSRIETCG